MPRSHRGDSPFTRRISTADRLQFLLLGPRDLLLYLVCLRFGTFIRSFELLPPRYLAWSSLIRARRAFQRASGSVPAYRAYLDATAGGGEAVATGEVPETDKRSYISAYPIASRCVGGRIGSARNMIDESSGSTGIPYNWIRSPRERLQSHLMISYFSRYCFGPGPWITLNAFSMGAWATGINMGMALQRISIVKNTGPDFAKLMHTLEAFGPSHDYLLLGYPPFLKRFIDHAEEQGFPLERFRLDALVGGEGMSEGLRDYLLRRFRRVYSGYGATDLEIGMAGETPVSVAIRRLARDRPEVGRALFGGDSRLPMVFQYNPLMHYVEVNANRELVFTITRASLLSPRVRYNIHDEGGQAGYDEMAALLARFDLNLDALSAAAGGARRLRLPFLWVFGRRDSTVSVMGANIYPEDLEQCLYAEPELARITISYCLALEEEEGGNARPAFLFEITAEPTAELEARFASRMSERLRELNADYRAAWGEDASAVRPCVRLHRPGEGPFKPDAGAIKQRRLLAPRV